MGLPDPDGREIVSQLKIRYNKKAAAWPPFLREFSATLFPSGDLFPERRSPRLPCRQLLRRKLTRQLSAVGNGNGVPRGGSETEPGVGFDPFLRLLCPGVKLEAVITLGEDIPLFGCDLIPAPRLRNILPLAPMRIPTKSST